MIQDTFQDFLLYTNSQNQISLALAQDEAEKNDFARILIEHHFQNITDVPALLHAIEKPSKIFYLMSENSPKEMYEFMDRYPTGHIGIYERSLQKMVVGNPIYKNVSICFVITKQTIEKIHQLGYTVLDKVGLTYQR